MGMTAAMQAIGVGMLPSMVGVPPAASVDSSISRSAHGYRAQYNHPVIISIRN